MNTKVLIALSSMFICCNFIMSSQNNVDIRKFGLEFPHNKQDEQGNTFWHQLALVSNGFQDWKQVQEQENIFRTNNNNWLPNPLIENKQGKTAKQEAKEIFKKTGNPVSGLLAVYLRQSEEGYLDKTAQQFNREMMKVAQNMEHPHMEHPNKK